MEKEFFDKYINMSETEMLKGAIYGQCRIMDKEDVYNWIYEDELKLKKQKEIINKIEEKIKKNIKNAKYEITTLTITDRVYYKYIDDILNDLLQILEDKEV